MADFAVIYGNKVEPNGIPSPRLIARLEAGVEIYNKGLCQKIIVSGGVGKEMYDEAKAMKEYLITKGVKSEDIIEDNKGINSYMTGRFCRNISKHNGWTSCIVVTQYFHISRTSLSLRKFGFRNVGSIHARFFEIRDIYSTFREVPAYIKYLFRNYK